MSIKDFMTKKVLEHKLKGVPESQKEMIIAIVKNNPKLFEKIQKEIEKMKKSGQDEMMSSMSVMKKYQSEIQKAMQGIK